MQKMHDSIGTLRKKRSIESSSEVKTWMMDFKVIPLQLYNIVIKGEIQRNTVLFINLLFDECLTPTSSGLMTQTIFSQTITKLVSPL
jgi:hypothetical protein